MQQDNDLREATYTSRAIRFWQRKLSQKQMEAYAKLIKTNPEQAAIHQFYQLTFAAAMQQPASSSEAVIHLQTLQKKRRIQQQIHRSIGYAIAAVLAVGVCFAGFKLFCATAQKPHNIANNNTNKNSDSTVHTRINTLRTTPIIAHEKSEKPIKPIMPQLKPALANKKMPIAYINAVKAYQLVYQELDKALQDSFEQDKKHKELDRQYDKCAHNGLISASTDTTNRSSLKRNIFVLKTFSFSKITYSKKIKILNLQKKNIEARKKEAEKQVIHLQKLCKATQDDIDDCPKINH
jgi:hypothetical protein